MNKIFHKIFTFLGIVFSWPLFFLSLFVPRDKNLWVFIGWHNSPEGEVFADNCKYFFLYTSQNYPNIKSVWLAKDEKLAEILRQRGYQSYYQNSLRGILCALRAGFTIIDAFLQRENYRWSGRSKIVQLLHGKGMKGTGYSGRQLRRQDFIFGTSPATLAMLPKTFTLDSCLRVTGYPRNRVFYEQIKDSDISVDNYMLSKLKEIKISSQNKTILYAPTFRRGIKEYNLEECLNLQSLSEWLRQNKLYFFINLHPKYRSQTRNLNLNNIFFIEESDIYPLLPYFDLLITDYSSIFADFLLLERPIVFYPYDFESYCAAEKLTIDYQNQTPGPKVTNPEQLKTAILDNLKNDLYQKEKSTMRKFYYQYQDGKAAERISDFLLR